MISRTNAIPVRSLNPEDLAGMEGRYVIAPEWRLPSYIPVLDENGKPIIPKEWYDTNFYDLD